MKLENQVCTLEQAQKLEQLGVNAPSIYYHRYPTNKWIVEPWGYFNPEEEGVEYLPAYNVAELGAMLPEFYASYKFYNPDGIKMHKCWNDDADDDEVIQITEAQTRAAMLIYCLENNLTTPEEVNQRLNNA